MGRANAAYYAGHDPFADFVTAPEISQMFGELLGAWAVTVWQSMGSPARLILAEAGPGRGTLMQDALRLASRLAPGFAAAAQLWLIETSPRLRGEQASRLPQAQFAASLGEIPAGPMILIANEFIDALPIRQFRKLTEGWAERFVEAGAFVEEPCAAPTHGLDPDAIRPGEIIESCPDGEAFVQSLASRLAAHNGAALLIDYGPLQSSPGDSLQALRGGQPADPLADPGGADLTAHVDFSHLARLARAAGAASYGPLAQGSFLSRLGLYQRAQSLARGKDAKTALRLMNEANRLADPTTMGSLFKVLALTAPHLPAPAGFAP